MKQTEGRDGLVVVHTSDLHLSDSTELAPLEMVLEAAAGVQARLLLMAGDIFDHNRVSMALLERTADLLAGTGIQVVVLPGNHDPLTPDSAYVRGDLGQLGNVHVLGLTEEVVHFPELGVEVWGRAHRDYADMDPLRPARPRRAQRSIAMAHGHFVPSRPEPGRFVGSWLIDEEDLEATEADYVALGHWNHPAKVGRGKVLAYYSGSPQLAQSVNVVRFDFRQPAVERLPLLGLHRNGTAGRG